MKHESTLCCLATLAYVCAHACAQMPIIPVSQDVTAFVEPTQESFSIRDPIEVAVTVDNRGGQRVYVEYDYHGGWGLAFSCAGIPKSPPLLGSGAFGRQMSYLSVGIPLEPHSRLTRRHALNRFLTFEKPGEYTVQYSVRIIGDMTDGAPFRIQGSGEFEVSIKDVPSDVNRRGEYRQALQGSALYAAEEAAEMLLWANSVAEMMPLIDSMDQVSAYGPDAIKRLGSMYGRDAAAANAVATVAITSGRALAAAFEMYEGMGRKVPYDLYRHALSSSGRNVRYQALVHLKEHGTEVHLPLVRQLIRAEKDEHVLSIARAVLEAIDRRSAP